MMFNGAENQHRWPFDLLSLQLEQTIPTEAHSNKKTSLELKKGSIEVSIYILRVKKDIIFILFVYSSYTK